jgi:hypothetical protein
MDKEYSWADDGTDANFVRRQMSRVSLFARKEQFTKFMQVAGPSKKDKVLDVGPTEDELLADSNFFEKLYPFKRKLHIASIENCQKLVRQFQLDGYTKIKAGKKLPFGTQSFDVVVSWATLEHVGNKSQQKAYLEEIFRVGKRFFVTTPDKANPYEPHTATLFCHWFPANVFRRIVKIIGKDFWALEKNLNILSYEDALKMVENLPGVKVERYKLGGVVPSNLMIYKSSVENI